MVAPTPLALTMGEPGGVGPDIALGAWHRRRAEIPPFYLLADPDLIARRAAELGLAASIALVEPEEAAEAFAKSLPVVALRNRAAGLTGRADPGDAPAVLEAIERAVADVAAGRAAAIVTNPIHKKALLAAGFRFPGHTEFLGDLAGRFHGGPFTPVMMIASDLLRVVPVTIHVALRDVPGSLTTALIVQTGRIVAADLERRFKLDAPRLAVAGLNPHAGEGGAFGDEDSSVIAPAIALLREGGVDATGPWPADTMFHAEARATYDAAICMYHDQALIPAKTLAFDTGVNVTLGLPFVRTSPDHGTALDIAGTGRARASSLIAALQLARCLAAD